MSRTTDRGRLSRRLISSLALGLALALSPEALRQSRAAPLTSTINLDAQELAHPILLNQRGKTISFSSKPQSGAVTLTHGALPSYVAYQVGGSTQLPKGFPTVVSGTSKSDPTGIGPLHLDAAVKTQLDQTLAKDGQAAVFNGKSTYLVKPLPPLFGSSSTQGGTTLAWIATEKSASSASTTTQASVPTTVEAQTLIPSSITGPITNSKLVKDMEHLFTIKSGKLVNWNQQTLDALESDLKLSSPKNAAPKALASTSKPELAAQVIDGTGAGTGGSPQPAPVPEPATLIVFGCIAAALGIRQVQAKRQ